MTEAAISAFERNMQARKEKTQEAIDNLGAQRLAHVAAVPEWVQTMRSVRDEVSRENEVLRNYPDKTPLNELLERAAQVHWLIEAAKLRQQAIERLRTLNDRAAMERFETHIAGIQAIDEQIRALRGGVKDKMYRELKQRYEQAKADLMAYMHSVQ